MVRSCGVGSTSGSRVALLLAACALWLVHGVHAQMVEAQMATEPVEWTSPRVIVILILAGLTLPLYIGTLVVLTRRRKIYPIAGRGARYFFVFNCNSLIGTVLVTITHIAYPNGMPCGMHVVGLWLFAPYSLAMIMRCWRLVFNIEIMNFLAEMSWRQSKRARLLERGDKSPGLLAGGDGGDGATTVRATGFVRVSSRRDLSHRLSKAASFRSGQASVAGNVAETGPLAMPSLDPASIEGHAFITRRKFVEDGWVAAIVATLSSALFLLIVLVSRFDADIAWTNTWRAQRGLEPSAEETAYLAGFFHGPRCFVYSVKIQAFNFAMGITLPFIAWVGWRLKLSTDRMERRNKEQAAFEAALAAEAGLALQVQTSARSSVTGAAATSIDELSANKAEMGATALFGTSCLVCFQFMTALKGYEWVSLLFFFTLLGLFLITCVPPIQRSYAIARKHREMLRRARRYGRSDETSRSGGSSSGSGGSKGSKANPSKIVATVPHHRPLYRLAHVLRDAHAYPALLKFLQKEYSSENALFYLESRRFSTFCRELERAVPGWTSSLDEDEESLATINSAGDGIGTQLVSAVRVVGGGGGGGSGASQLNPRRATALSSIHVHQPSGVLDPIESITLPPPTISPSPSVSSPAETSQPPAHESAPALDGVASPTLLFAAPHPASRLSNGLFTLSSRTASAQSKQPSSPQTNVVVEADDQCVLLPGSVAHTTASTVPSAQRSSRARDQLTSSAGSTAAHAPAAAASKRAPPVVHPAVRLSFRQLHERATRARQWALQLHADYLQPNAVYQINIANDLAKMVTAQVNQLRPWQPTPLTADGQPDYERAAMESAPPPPPPFPLSSLYKQTALSVFNLMEMDSFRRFLLTPDFQLLLQRADDQEMERLGAQSDMNAATQALLQRADAMLNLDTVQQMMPLEIEVPRPPSA